MKYDEFAFFNQQLAAMLRDGIPLEGALKRLCEDMRQGQLRDELQALEADLARGTPMAEALKARRLPELYKRMILLGIKSGDLPGALTMLADYFQRQNNLWTRIKGLMVYPMIVLSMAFLLSCFIAFLLGHFVWNSLVSLTGQSVPPAVASGLWLAPVCIGVALAAGLIGIGISPARRKLRWRLPAFKEASLAQVASAMTLMLKNGVPLNDALGFVEQMEEGTPAEKELGQWRQRQGSGMGKFSEMAALPQSVFPPLFVWSVSQSGENLAAGFERTSEIYQARAAYRVEMFLYSLLPCAILGLGAMILSQIQPVMAALLSLIKNLGGD
ncbi:MAG TPA: type II secretion system F family protein [Pseudomonadales bacterium]|nr:type II secretion system F family protein [Pseudomonadales bacterium]